MSSLAGLLDQLYRDGISIAAEGERLAVSPAERVTPTLRTEILQHKADLLELAQFHGSNLLNLFRDPPARGRSGPAEFIWGLIDKPVRLSDGREGTLRLASYDTRTGRVRCRVEVKGERLLLDPEDINPVAKNQQGKTA